MRGPSSWRKHAVSVWPILVNFGTNLIKLGLHVLGAALRPAGMRLFSYIILPACILLVGTVHSFAWGECSSELSCTMVEVLSGIRICAKKSCHS